MLGLQDKVIGLLRMADCMKSYNDLSIGAIFNDFERLSNGNRVTDVSGSRHCSMLSVSLTVYKIDTYLGLECKSLHTCYSSV